VAEARRRRRWTVEQKRRIVEETSGASVSVVARRYDINANLLFKWKREAEAGQLGGVALADARGRGTRADLVGIVDGAAAVGRAGRGRAVRDRVIVDADNRGDGVLAIGRDPADRGGVVEVDGRTRGEAVRGVRDVDDGAGIARVERVMTRRDSFS
jgi:transposase-like protein